MEDEVAGILTGLSQSVSDTLSSLRRHPIIGLSIEGSDLRLICVDGRSIVRIVSKPLAPELMPGGIVADPAAFGLAVRTILNEYELPRATVVAGFPDVSAIGKMLILPRDATAKIAQVVEREARRDPVIGNGEYRIFHQTVNKSTTSMTVFVLAVRSDPLDRYLAGLKHAGITPQLVELRSLAMIRAINQPHTIIVNVERTSFDIVIVSNNLPVIMRTMALSGNDAEIVQDVVSELERTIDSYNSNQPHPLNQRLPVALTGEFSTLPDLQQAVTARLDRPIVAPTCPYAAPAGFDVANFVVNIGLTLKAR
jgi:Tfp pilus assembly PilM family ATPase